MGVAKAILDGNDDARRFGWLETGTVVALAASTGRVVVNLSGGEVEIDSSAPVRVGDLVRVFRSQSTQPQLVGRANFGPVTGSIQKVTAGVSVDVKGDQDDVTYTMPYLLTYTPTVGDGVAIDWDRWTVLGKLSTLAGVGDPTVVPPKPPTPTSGTTVFTALGSGSYRQGRWWTSKVYYSESNLGAWFYGTKVRDTLRGKVAQGGCKIYLPVESASGANFTQLGVHDYASQPGGAPSIGGLRSIGSVDHTDWWDLPTDIAQYMIDHAGAGIGTAGPGYRIFSAVPGDSGKVSINWKG